VPKEKQKTSKRLMCAEWPIIYCWIFKTSNEFLYSSTNNIKFSFLSKLPFLRGKQRALKNSYVFVSINTVSVMLLVGYMDTVGNGMFSMLTSFGRMVTTMGYFIYIMYPIML
jgi:hypothetical protein